MNWGPDELDQLERAITEGARIQISRRGTEYVLLPLSLHSEGATEILVATTTMGDDLEFRLNEVDYFHVLR
jgi:hypothetical protein